MTKFYRCGWCGHPCDKDGRILSLMSCGIPKDYEGAEAVQGDCCKDEYQQEEPQYITRDMAIDAQDMSIEGQRY